MLYAQNKAPSIWQMAYLCSVARRGAQCPCRQRCLSCNAIGRPAPGRADGLRLQAHRLTARPSWYQR